MCFKRRYTYHIIPDQLVSEHYNWFCDNPPKWTHTTIQNMFVIVKKNIFNRVVVKFECWYSTKELAQDTLDKFRSGELVEHGKKFLFPFELNHE